MGKHRDPNRKPKPKPNPKRPLPYDILPLPTKSFDVSTSSGHDYNEFIKSFDSAYFEASVEMGSRSRPYLLKQTDKGFRIFDVEVRMDGEAGAVRVKFRFRADNLYLIGFCNSMDDKGNEKWFGLTGWGDEKDIVLLSMIDLPGVSVDYGCLAKGNRDLILGKHPRTRAILELSNFNLENLQNEGKKKEKNGINEHLYVVCQMFPEAMRFRCIRETIAQPKHYDEGRKLKAYQILLQNNWLRMCNYYYAGILEERRNPNFRMENLYLELRTLIFVDEFSTEFEGTKRIVQYTGRDMDRLIANSVQFAHSSPLAQYYGSPSTMDFDTTLL